MKCLLNWRYAKNTDFSSQAHPGAIEWTILEKPQLDYNGPNKKCHAFYYYVSPTHPLTHSLFLNKIVFTFKGIIQVLFIEDNSQIMNGTCMELHSKDDIPSRATEFLVIAFQLPVKEGIKETKWNMPSPWESTWE